MSTKFYDVESGDRVFKGAKVRFTSPNSGREYRGWVVRVRTTNISQHQHQRGDLITVQLDGTNQYRMFYDCEADYEILSEGA